MASGIKLPVDHRVIVQALADNEMIGMHHEIGKINTPLGDFELNNHVLGLCMWIRSPSTGKYYQISHQDMWQNAVATIIEHEQGNAEARG